MSADDQDTRDFYTQPAVMTSPGQHASLLPGLPDEPAAIAAVLHGLVIHDARLRHCRGAVGGRAPWPGAVPGRAAALLHP